MVAARAFQGEASAVAFAKATAGPLAPTGDLMPIVLDRDLDAVWWTFPNDRRLRRLADLMRPTSDIATLLPGERGWRSSEVVELAPERSVTLRATDGSGTTLAFVKAYAPGSADVASLARRYDVVASGLAEGGFAVRAPASLATLPARDVLVLQPMEGLRWADLRGGVAPDMLARLGAAFAAVHTLEPPAGTTAFTRLSPGRVARSADLVARARPDVAVMAQELARALAGTTPPEDHVFLHGDCHPKNAFFDHDVVALVDFDQAGVGPAATDIASLLARLMHGRVIGEATSAPWDALAAAFLDGYATVRPLPSEASLRWHTAAALLAERALRAVNRVHVDALEQLGALLAAATDTLRRVRK